jgi:hypothetical protein
MSSTLSPPPATHTGAVYHFAFEGSVNLAEVEATLRLALLAAEGLHGEARVRLDATYHVDPEAKAVVVDSSTAVGASLVGVFAALVIKEFGGKAMTVRRVAAPAGEVTP